MTVSLNVSKNNNVGTMLVKANNQTSVFLVSLVPQELQGKMSPRTKFAHPSV